MRWTHVARNWGAFQDRILDRWPAADPDELAAIDGDRDRFAAYLADLTGQSEADVAEDLRDWLDGEVPADVVMDSAHDAESMTQAERYVPEGEDPSDDDRRFGDDARTEPPPDRDPDGPESPPNAPPVGRRQ